MVYIIYIYKHYNNPRETSPIAGPASNRSHVQLGGGQHQKQGDGIVDAWKFCAQKIGNSRKMMGHVFGK